MDALVRSELDIYAPCALGGALDDATVAELRARIVCGAANNQLAHPGIEKVLEDRGILYAPDYVVNAGGLIQVADEVDGFRESRARARATRIYDTTRCVSVRGRGGCPRQWLRTGWPSDEWPRSVGSVGFGSREVAQPLARPAELRPPTGAAIAPRIRVAQRPDMTPGYAVGERTMVTRARQARREQTGPSAPAALCVAGPPPTPG